MLFVGWMLELWLGVIARARISAKLKSGFFVQLKSIRRSG
uniref:Uncharacterized protein n=1 Tax=Manihot esculenta TaxID=3983 RepID=A0A2C9U8Z1_MANES